MARAVWQPWLVPLAVALGLAGCSQPGPSAVEPGPADAGIGDAPSDDVAVTAPRGPDIESPTLDAAVDIAVDPPCAATCADDNPCTQDTCKHGKCAHVAVAAACSDDNLCTTGDFCDGGACSAGAWLNCDDGQACTTDGCSAASGCLHAADVTECTDGDACTVGDLCQDAVCLAGPVTACDDGNACTDDQCDVGQGCVFTPNSLACADDKDGCTTDVCSAGTCTHEVQVGLPCDDGSACTKGDNCQPGGCAGQPAVWTKMWGLAAPIVFVNSITPAQAGGWAIAGGKYTQPGSPNQFTGGLMRFDAQGNAIWAQSYSGIPSHPAEWQGGWAVAFQSNVSFLDPVGKLLSSVPLPNQGPSGYVMDLIGDGDNVIGASQWNYNGPGVGTHRFFPYKATVKSVLIDKDINFVHIKRTDAGFVACSPGGIGSGFRLYYLNDNLEVTKKLMVPLPGVEDWEYDSCRVGKDGNGNTLLWGQIGYYLNGNYTPNSKSFVASVTTNGTVAWYLPLTAAGLGTGPVQSPRGGRAGQRRCRVDSRGGDRQRTSAGQGSYRALARIVARKCALAQGHGWHAGLRSTLGLRSRGRERLERVQADDREFGPAHCRGRVRQRDLRLVGGLLRQGRHLLRRRQPMHQRPVHGGDPVYA